MRNSFTAKDAEDAKEEKSLTAKCAKDAEEENSFTAKAAKDRIIRTRPQGRGDNAKVSTDYARATDPFN